MAAEAVPPLMTRSKVLVRRVEYEGGHLDAPGAQTHFVRGADAIDSAASSLGEYNGDAAISWLSQAVNEVNQAVALVRTSTVNWAGLSSDWLV